MKGSRFSEEQIIVVLREHEAGIANARALAKMYACPYMDPAPSERRLSGGG